MLQARALGDWLTSLAREQLLTLRYVLETAVSDCDGDPAALTLRPLKAADDQMKFVPQF